MVSNSVRAWAARVSHLTRLSRLVSRSEVREKCLLRPNITLADAARRGGGRDHWLRHQYSTPRFSWQVCVSSADGPCRLGDADRRHDALARAYFTITRPQPGGCMGGSDGY